MIKIALNFEFQGIDPTFGKQNSDHECAKTSSFAVLHIKLWLKSDILHKFEPPSE